MKFLSILILFFALNCLTFGQTPESKTFESQIELLTSRVGVSFMEGLKALQDNRRSAAREKFDKSIEEFLMSGINLTAKSNEKAGNCYNQLIETIYQIEFPANKNLANTIKFLSTVCGWDIENGLVQNISRSVPTLPRAEESIDDMEIMRLQRVVLKTEIALLQARQRYDKAVEDLKRNKITDSQFSLISNDFNNAVGVYNAAFEAYKYPPKRIKKSEKDGFKEQQFIPPVKDNLLKIIPTDSKSSNEKPVQSSDGKVPAVIKFLNETLDDPYSVRFVSWGKLEEKIITGKQYWSVQVKYRAKNTYNAYVLTEVIFYIENGKVVKTEKVS